jgi:hypothetical protein
MGGHPGLGLPHGRTARLVELSHVETGVALPVSGAIGVQLQLNAVEAAYALDRSNPSFPEPDRRNFTL